MTKTKTKNYKINENAKPFYYNTGSDCAVLFIHGFTDSLGNLKDQIDDVREMGISCMGVCLPGHGTHYLDLENYGPEDLVRSVEESLDILKKNHNKVYVVGVSVGGNIAFDVAARDPQKIDGIVCIATTTKFRFHNTIKFLIPLARPFYKYHKRIFYKHLKKQYLDNGCYEYFPLKTVWKLLYFLDKNRKELKKVKAPTLVIKVKNKLEAPDNSAAFIFENLGSNVKKLEEVYDYNFEKSKDKIFRLAIEFFELSNKFKEKKK